MRHWIKGNSIVLTLLLVVAIMGIIFYFSAQPAEDSGAMSSGLTLSILSAIVPNFQKLTPEEQRSLCGVVEVLIRKLGHFSEYAALGFALMLHIQQLKKRISVRVPWLWAWGVGTLYAVSDELHQGFVPGRSPMVTDVLIDSAGVIAGVGVMLVILWIQQRRESKRGV